jgi:hypothetical protein
VSAVCFSYGLLVRRDETPEQRVKILFCVLLHKSPPETLRKLEETYGNVAVKETQVYEWRKRFRDGRVSVNDDSRCGPPSTSTNDANMERVRHGVRNDGRKNVQETTAEVGISVGSVHSQCS